MPTARADLDHEVHQTRMQQAMADYFNRQHQTVRDGGERAASDLLDPEVWLAELLAVLGPLLRDVATEAGRSVAAALGVVYDVARTLDWLAMHTQRVAGAINATTLDDLDAALTADDPASEIARLFENAITVRSDQIGVSAVTELAAWGAREAASQGAEQTGQTATKTWRTTSSGPRASHARLNGQTIPEGERFGNGLLWPGESGRDPDERVNCRCVLEVGIGDGG